MSQPASSARIRVAVIGVGEFGRNHARVYRELQQAELVGVLDANAARAGEVAAEYGVAAIENIEALRGRVDAVSLAIPTAQHASLGCALLKMGLDVLVEKPMAASLEQADELIAAAKCEFSRAADRASRAI